MGQQQPAGNGRRTGSRVWQGGGQRRAAGGKPAEWRAGGGGRDGGWGGDERNGAKRRDEGAGAALTLAEEAGGRALASVGHVDAAALGDVALAANVVVHALVVPARETAAVARGRTGKGTEGEREDEPGGEGGEGRGEGLGAGGQLGALLKHRLAGPAGRAAREGAQAAENAAARLGAARILEAEGENMRVVRHVNLRTRGCRRRRQPIADNEVALRSGPRVTAVAPALVTERAFQVVAEAGG